MKHQLFAAMVSMSCVMAGAQALTVTSINQVKTSFPVEQAVISPNGEKVIASSLLNNELTQVMVADGSETRVASNGSIYALSFSDDSRTIAYVSETTSPSRLRYKEVKALNLDNLVETQLLAPSRTFNAVQFRGGEAVVVNDAAASLTRVAPTHAVSSEATASRPVAFTYYGELMLSVDGRTVALNPQGKDGQSYLWPTVSPDGTKVAYYLGAVGAFVCNIDGTDIRPLGLLRAPCWLDNNTVVGMRDYDDGTYITASAIVASDLEGNSQTLTPESMIALYPSVSATGKIAFTTPEGQLFVINVTR